MKENRISAVVLLIVLLAVLVVVISWGTSPTPLPPSPSEQRKELATLKEQIALLEQRVDWLVERQTAPHRQKELPF